jgi:hypothetical protein
MNLTEKLTNWLKGGKKKVVMPKANPLPMPKVKTPAKSPTAKKTTSKVAPKTPAPKTATSKPKAKKS